MSGNGENFYIFSKVLNSELELIKSLRTGNIETPQVVKDEETKDCKETCEGSKHFKKAHKANLAGLAFSGGGIRSATFNLGVIQAFSKSIRSTDKYPERPGLLPLFDYLSTVSGGGYIGCWLTSFLHREEAGSKKQSSKDNKIVNAESVRETQAKVSTRPCSFGATPDDDSICIASSGFSKPRTSGFPPLEHAAIRHLRRFSNYLSPKLGISGDLLAIISLFLRNIVVLQLGLISLVATVLLIPYLVTSISVYAIDSGKTPVFPSLVFFFIGIVFMTCTLIIWWSQFRKVDTRKRLRLAQKTSGAWMVFSMVFLMFGLWLIIISAIPMIREAYESAGELPMLFILIYALLYFIAWNLSPGSTVFYSKHPAKNGVKRLSFAFIVSILFGFLIHFCAVLFHAQMFVSSVGMAFATVFGAPIVLLVTSFVIAVQLGLSRDLFLESEREWWGRTGGLTLLTAGLWLLIFSTAIYAPAFVKWLGIGGWAVLFSWASASSIGAWIARNMTQASTVASAEWKTLLIRTIPWFFLIGLAIIISYGLSLILGAISYDIPLLTNLIPHFSEISMMWLLGIYSMLAESVPIGLALSMLASFFGLFLLFSWRTDLNIFSAHAIYKNRLVRAYLGASNLANRMPHPYTGFDSEDDIAINALARQRPIPIINTTINMTGGDDLAWQTRRAASFTFTPEFVGFEAKSSKGQDLGGYRKTVDYGSCETFSESLKNVAGCEKNEITLGTVLAISGAAASPNMGYHTSASISALLTVFNLRLGCWTGNPAHKDNQADSKFSMLLRPFGKKYVPSWRRKRPLLSALPLISELTGSANAESSWINLTDGGHFDNLGIYELIRRRCRFIVVTDAGCDPEYQFQDLANSIRKCWTDFGVHIFFPDLGEITIENKNERHCRQHGSLGLIEYPDRQRPNGSDSGGHEERYGLVLYLKCSLTKIELENFVDIRQYSESNEQFPHEPTSDQFFDENQFEAYRHLGYCIAAQYRSMIEKFVDSKTGLLKGKAILKQARKINKIQSKVAHQDKWGAHD